MSEIAEKKIDDLVTRPYQQAIIDVCIQRNSIVYLPTGAGKSYIAVQVIKHFSRDLETKYSAGGKRSLFLTNTVVLAKQQAEVLEGLLPFKVALVCGESGVDSWKHEDWAQLLEDNEIIVATAQCIVDAVKHSFLKLEQVNVVVFDECHRGTKDHPFKELMKMFETLKENLDLDKIRVIGLSGMLIGNDNKITEHSVAADLETLECVFRSTIVTVNNLDHLENALLCSTKAKESLIAFRAERTSAVVDQVNGILMTKVQQLGNVKIKHSQDINPRNLRPTAPRKIKELVALLKDFHFQAFELGAYGGYLSLLSSLVELELTKRYSDSEDFREVVKGCITVVENCILIMKSHLQLHLGTADVIYNNSSHKVCQLIGALKFFFNDVNREKDLQCIVFVKRRSTAKVLYHILDAYRKYDNNFPIIPDFMVGMNASLNVSIDTILNNNFLSLTLEKFKNKEKNCIVSTDVLEEGIDLQMCNLVVAFEAPITFRSYVQARGRARDDKSHYVVLIEDIEKAKFEQKVVKWRGIDARMKKLLHLKTIDRKAPSEEGMQREHVDLWEPFKTPIGSVLNSMNCISLLTRYASAMPSDKFTNVSIVWERIDLDEGKILVSLELPSQCAIQDKISGEPKGGVRMAKQHAAFVACKMLYEAGELDDNLVPFKDDKKVELVHGEYFSHWESYANDSKKAGTTKHRRYHQIKTPKALVGSAPRVGEMNFLYRINVRPKFNPEGKKSIGKLHKLLSNEKEFGILTSRRIPRLCIMTLFQTYGEVEVEIDGVPVALHLQNEQQLKILQDFHLTIFRDILQTWQPYFVLDKTSYLIVPLAYGEIDWSLAQRFDKVLQPKLLTYDEKMATKFTREEYHETVINPVYRDEGLGIKPDRKYVVTEVHEEMSPLSPFPNEGYDNFKDYVEQRCNVTVGRLDQPMIEVKGISNSLNLFFPGGGVTGKQRKHEKQQLTEYYIPELCHNYKFPADLWLKATMLPSICHRMHFLLLAEELRAWLIAEGIDKSSCQQNYKLDVDYGDYDHRKKTLEEIARENESMGQLPDYYKSLLAIPQTSTTETRHRAQASLLWNRNELPKDLDRHWQTLTEVDIEYYCGFLEKNQNKAIPSYILRKIEEARTSPKRGVQSLMDSSDRQSIGILKLDGYGPGVQQKDLIKVLTTSNAGDVFDMERHEVLGDAFLKFISSLYLYKKYPAWHEGQLTALKGRIVSNRNLFYAGDKFGLSQMIKSTQFNAYETLQPSIRMPANLQAILEENMELLKTLYSMTGLTEYEIAAGLVNERTLQEFSIQRGYAIEQDETSADDNVDKSLLTYINRHHVGDKVVADAVEAFLGVVVSSVGCEGALKLCQKLGVLPNEDLSGLLSEKIPPRVLMRKGVPVREARVQNRAELERIIGYQFKDVSYLVQALTHRSNPIKTHGTYEQLEFLGDAALDFLVTCYISEQCGSLGPGKLTDLRSALVNNVTLACIVVRNGIHKFLMAENVTLSDAIKRFVAIQTSMDHQVVLDQIILLETEDDMTPAEAIDVPKVVGDIFESIVGAVYLDSGSLEVTWKVIYGLLKKEIHEFIADVPKQIVRKLYEHNKGALEPEFFDAEIINEDIVMVPLVINMNENGKSTKKIFYGSGKNKTLAKKCAAKRALNALKVR